MQKMFETLYLLQVYVSLLMYGEDEVPDVYLRMFSSLECQ